MSYNTKNLLTDGDGKPIPQYYNPTTDEFEPLYGENNATRHSIVGSFANVNKAPVVGAKTIGTVAAELFAGASRLSNRQYMEVFNEGTLPIYYGASGVTTANGFPIQPGEYRAFAIDATPIYAIASANNAVRVEER